MAGAYSMGEFDPDTLERESKLREGLRDILRMTPDVRNNDLLAEVKRLKELADRYRELAK